MMRNILTIAAIAVLAIGSTGCEKLKARDNLNKGVQAFKNADYPGAVNYFQKAVELDPSFETTHLYLASAYMSQYIPGAESEENKRLADQAFKSFQKALELDPKNELATASIASLYFQQKEFEKAKEWNRKLLEINPQNKEAYYTLGVIAYLDWLGPQREARAKLNMKPEDPGPIKDAKVREELRAKYMASLDEGIRNVEKALEIDPEYDDAMAYMNLLIRYRADLLDTTEEWKKESEVADNWIQKALQTKKIKAERMEKSASGGITAE